MKNIFFATCALFSILLLSCSPSVEKDGQADTDTNTEKSELFVATLTKHLNAVSNADLVTLGRTMSPEGKMQLILPGSEIQDSAGFMEYHEAWFADTTAQWTFETEILNYEIDDRLGYAIVQIIYKEAERDGKPYFNRMIVSYILEYIDNEWYIIKDHASSIEKSTDQQ